MVSRQTSHDDRVARYRLAIERLPPTKDRDYWRYETEREGAFKARRQRQFV
jgi:hypothetical protein